MAQKMKVLLTTGRIRQLLTVFICLQALDVLTTLYGFRVGASESSPFVRLLLALGPVTGLVISKLIATTLAVGALLNDRDRLVRFVNFWFVAVVGWNLVIIAVAVGRA